MSELNVGTVTTTAGVNLANYTNATRPASGGTVGRVIYNTDEGISQVWDGLAWVNIDQYGGPFKAEGGDVVDTSSVPNYTLHVFRDSGTFTVKAAPSGSKIDVLIVGGGGGGGGGANATWHGGAGGGGGGVRLLANYTVTPNTAYTITVGNGGAGGQGANSPGNNGSPGQSSAFIDGATSYIALGGGYGDAGLGGGTGGSGGSGGGEAAGSSPTGAGRGTRQVNGTNDISIGHNGGRWYNSGAPGGDPYGCGGGGAGGAGHFTAVNYAGTGGHGIDLSTVFGTAHGDSGVFAGGGGGGGADDDTNYNSNNSGYRAAGGPGGGGNGGGGGLQTSTGDGLPGANNTGGGGGGGYGGTPQFAGASGGKGIVIVRYKTAPNYSPLLGDPQNPAASAVAIKAARPTAGDGIYWINTSWAGPVPFWCDMTTDGGGWMLVYKSGNWPNQGCSNGNYFEFPQNGQGGGDIPPLSVLGDAEWNLNMYKYNGLSPANRGALWTSASCSNYAMSGHSYDQRSGNSSPNQGTGTYKTVFHVKSTQGGNWNDGSNIWAYYAGGTQFSNPPGNGFPNGSLGNIATGIGSANSTTAGSTYEISSLGNYACNCCEGYYTNTGWGGIQWFGDGYGVANASAVFAQTTNFWIK